MALDRNDLNPNDVQPLSMVQYMAEQTCTQRPYFNVVQIRNMPLNKFIEFFTLSKIKQKVYKWHAQKTIIAHYTMHTKRNYSKLEINMVSIAWNLCDLLLDDYLIWRYFPISRKNQCIKDLNS